MCVILLSNKDRPSIEMIRSAWRQNDAGGGVAWREDGFVRWEKGIMNLEQMEELCLKVPLPFIAHFRIPSYGGKRESLCHPFPIEKKVSLALSGKTKGNVLFHNGHWGKWKESMLDAVIKSGIPVPVGKWSDTRAMAFHAAIYGLGILELIDEKAVAFGPDVCEIFPGSGWKIIDKIWCSNDFFRGTENHYHHGGYSNIYKMCSEAKCTKVRLHDSEFCYEHKNLAEAAIVIPDSDTEELPVINIDSKVVDDKEDSQTKIDRPLLSAAQIAVNKAVEIEKKDLDLRKSARGGGAKVLPFVLADKLFKEHKLSKNKWKKARRAHLKEGKSLKRHQMKLAVEKFHEMKDAPMVITH